MPEELFDFVVARPWFPEKPGNSLAIYAYGSEIQHGTMEDAESFLEYVRFSSINEPRKQWSIYQVLFQKVEE
jgi:hypothetical protein